MTIVLDGSSGITAPGGTAAAPSITTTGDVNTGIFFPAADTIAFSEGGAEAMRIDSSGNVGIGTASPAAKLHVVGDSLSNTFKLIANTAVSGSDATIFRPADNTMAFSTNGSERARIDSSGNLGIGTTSPATKFVVSDGGGIGFEFVPASGLVQSYNRSTSAYSTFICDGSLFTWRPSGTEAMRINSSGNLLVGTSSSGVYGGVVCRLEVVTSTASNGAATFKNANAGTQTIGVWNATDSGTRYFIEFSDGSTRATRGSITSNGTATAYNTTSDYRLKTVLGAVANAGQRIDALQPVEYTWNANGERARGFLAHQFQEVYASSVSGTKDAVDVEGNPVYQAMQASTSEVIADLVAELQSVRARLAALESK